ncbi:MAG: hypothetical protein Q7J35_10105 [Candidatus Methanoperedens sp.]|nr:hypothetical protein [Candidatus Methanoperedens sp.]
MKNNNWPKILMSLVAALFILSLFSGIAVAQTPKESYDKTKEQYQELKTKYDAAKQKYLDSKIKFIAAKDKFKIGRTNLGRDELINKTRDYLIKSIDYVINHLEVLKNKIDTDKEFIPFNAVDNINTHITELNEIKAEVEGATTPTKLADAARQLDDLMIKMNLEGRYYASLIVNHKIDQFIVNADNASMRMSTLIQKLEGQGKDVTRLKEYASTFDSLVSDAKTTHQSEVTLFETHSGFDNNGFVTSKDDGRSFLQQATNSQKDTIATLKSAEKQFREFFKEAKKIIPGKVVVEKGTGKIEASGTGIARIRGNVTVTLTVSGNATLIVSSNADVTVDETGTNETQSNGNIKYMGFSSATISGNDIKVEISGDNITLTAQGTGSAVLIGKGTYKSEKGFTASGEWTKKVD